MSTTFNRFIDGETITASVSTGYTAGTGLTAVIHKLAITNRESSDITVTIYLVPTGTASNDNLVANQQTIAPNDTWICVAAEEQVLEAGGTIQYICDTPDAASVICSGIEIKS